MGERIEERLQVIKGVAPHPRDGPKPSWWGLVPGSSEDDPTLYKK